MSKLDVLVVEDEPLIAKMLKLNLEHAGFTVRVAVNVAQAQEAVETHLPDVILIDWMLPDATGVQLTQALRRDPLTSKVFILMLTARSAEADRLQGFASGVDDYVSKPFSPKELIARIHALTRRARAPRATSFSTAQIGTDLRDTGHALDPAVGSLLDAAMPPKLAVGDITLDTEERCASVSQPVPHRLQLSPSEFRLLETFIQNAGKVLSRRRLMQLAWPHDTSIEERTIDVHVKRLRQTLQKLGRPNLLQTVRGLGYRLG